MQKNDLIFTSRENKEPEKKNLGKRRRLFLPKRVKSETEIDIRIAISVLLVIGGNTGIVLGKISAPARGFHFPMPYLHIQGFWACLAYGILFYIAGIIFLPVIQHFDIRHDEEFYRNIYRGIKIFHRVLIKMLNDR